MASWAGAISSPSSTGLVTYDIPLTDIGVVFFIGTNQTSTGWSTSNNSGLWYYTFFGMCSYGNLAHSTYVSSVLASYACSNTIESWGSGVKAAQCIHVRGTNRTSVMLEAALDSFGIGSFTLNWTTANPGYTIYYLALPNTAGYGKTAINNITFGDLPNMSGGSIYAGYGYDAGGYDFFTNNFQSSLVGMSGRQEGWTHSKAGWASAAYGKSNPNGYMDVFYDLPGDLTTLQSDPWVAGTTLDGWMSFDADYAQVGWYGNAVGWAWVSTEVNAFTANAYGGGIAAGTYVDQAITNRESATPLGIQPDFAITVGMPEYNAWTNHNNPYKVGGSIGFWSADANYHCTTAYSKSISGDACVYNDDVYSYISNFNFAGGNVNAGRITNEATPGYLRVYGDLKNNANNNLFGAFLGVLSDFTPQLFQWQQGVR